MPRRNRRPYRESFLILACIAALAACGRSTAPSEQQKLEQAATDGDAEAKYLLGQNYCCGLEEGKNDEKAVAWWCEAARSGHAEASFELGRLYQEEGLPMAASERYQRVSVKKDNSVALAWYITAEAQGSALAKTYRALLERQMNLVKRQQVYALVQNPRAIPCRYQGQHL